MTAGRKSFSRPPSKKANKELGGLPLRKKAPANTASMEPGMGNKERGFIQKTQKQGTGAMMGRAMPSGTAAKTSTRKDSRKQFKPKAGRKVF
jgi:hypothetical protein